MNKELYAGFYNEATAPADTENGAASDSLNFSSFPEKRSELFDELSKKEKKLKKKEKKRKKKEKKRRKKDAKKIKELKKELKKIHKKYECFTAEKVSYEQHSWLKELAKICAPKTLELLAAGIKAKSSRRNTSFIPCDQFTVRDERAYPKAFLSDKGGKR